jgi:hypothetical protein
MYDETGCTAYGKFYTMAYDGMIHAYDLHNGTHLWDYYGGSSGFETVYGQWPFYVVNGWAIADNKIFAPNGEHSPDSPTWRGWKLHVVDATTGKGVWNISGFMKNPAIADGYVVTLNLYDCQIYCFGKGDSATTVSAPQTVSAKGIPVVVSGTVTDQSPGKSKGTPAIADKDMTPWMEYIYEQQSKPATASGVQVKLVGIDPNGNNEEIGTVTSDMAGNYGVMWTPKMEGLYKIVASFEGSESYYASGAETYVGVGAAPLPSAIVTPTSTPTATPTATAAPTASPSPAASPPGYGLGTEYYVAIAAVVIIVVIAAVAIALRRRK